MGDTWDHAGGVKEVTRSPGLSWAGSKGLEGSRHLDDCQERRTGSAPGDEGLLASFDGLRKLVKLLHCCPGCTEVLGHASQPPFLSSSLSQHPKTERASGTISLPAWDPFHSSPSSAYTPQVTKVLATTLGSPDCQELLPSFESNPIFFSCHHPSS